MSDVLVHYEHAGMYVSGNVIGYKDRGYLTGGAIYEASPLTKAYLKAAGPLYERLGKDQFSAYTHTGDVVTEYGAVLKVYTLDRSMQKELNRKYRNGWTGINSSHPEKGEKEVMLRLEDGTVTWADPIQGNGMAITRGIGWPFWHATAWRRR